MAVTSKITNSVAPCIYHYSFSLGLYLLDATPILHVRLNLTFSDVTKIANPIESISADRNINDIK
jgi:hypothetical protein